MKKFVEYIVRLFRFFASYTFIGEPTLFWRVFSTPSAKNKVFRIEKWVIGIWPCIVGGLASSRGESCWLSWERYTKLMRSIDSSDFEIDCSALFVNDTAPRKHKSAINKVKRTIVINYIGKLYVKVKNRTKIKMEWVNVLRNAWLYFALPFFFYDFFNSKEKVKDTSQDSPILSYSFIP